MSIKGMMAAGALVVVGVLVAVGLGGGGEEHVPGDTAPSTSVSGSESPTDLAAPTLAPAPAQPTPGSGNGSPATADRTDPTVTASPEPVTVPPGPTTPPPGPTTPTEPSAATGSTTPAAPTVRPEALRTGDPADELVVPALQAQSEALAQPESDLPGRLEAIAEGSALGAMQSRALQFEVDGWSQLGEAEIVSTEVVSLDDDADPPVTEVLVCLDYAGVDVVDAEGVSMVDEGAPMRVPQLWTLERVDDRWVVVEQGFTEDTTC